MFSFVGEQINHHILRHIIESLCQINDLLVLADGRFVRADHSPDHGHDVGVFRRRLQRILTPRQLKRAWDTAAQHIDSFRQAPRMPQLQGDLFFERFPDQFRTCSFQVDRVSEVVLDRLQLVGVGPSSARQ